MNKIQILIISSIIDYSTDAICLYLSRHNKSYFRINRDCFTSYKVQYDVYKNELSIIYESEEYIFSNLKKNSIFFRAPVFIRTYNNCLPLDKQVYTSQWNSFIRNLVVFDKVKWMNNPVNTYKAENKMFQLREAKKVGLNIPLTKVSNYKVNGLQDKFIIKSLDTALFKDQKNEYFTYSNIVSKNEVSNGNLKLSPVFLQEYLQDKIDIRVTYINGNMYPVAITLNRQGIKNDWRLNNKDKLEYTIIQLPTTIKSKIKKMMIGLNLCFGGIDLVLSNNKYYFIEVNPTGEWCWIDSNCNLKLPEEICKFLCGSKK